MALATQLLFVPITAFTKVSVLLTYLREYCITHIRMHTLMLTGIFPSANNKWFCYAMLAFTTAWALIAFFLSIFQCMLVLLVVRTILLLLTQKSYPSILAAHPVP
jgi:hypothetical protein